MSEYVTVAEAFPNVDAGPDAVLGIYDGDTATSSVDDSDGPVIDPSIESIEELLAVATTADDQSGDEAANTRSYRPDVTFGGYGSSPRTVRRSNDRFGVDVD